MLRRFISLLPVLVAVAAVGIFVAYFVKQREIEEEQATRQKAAVAEKVNTLPESPDVNDADKKLADKAFASPELVDAALAIHYGRPVTMDDLYANPTSNSIPTKSQVEYHPRPMPHIGEIPTNAPATSKSNAEEVEKPVDPESEAYQERVDGLMEMRQRRLQESANRNTK